MNPRVPMEVLTPEQCAKVRELLAARGEVAAIRAVGLRDPAAFYKAAGGFPVARLTAEVIRGNLDRI